MTAFREAGPREIEVWDDLTVRPGGGHVLQSRAWAEHRRRTGWRPWFLVGDDGSAVLVLERPWPLLGGGSTYLPRGPIPTGSVEAMVERLRGAVAFLADRGLDVVASDAEVPAGLGYEAGIAALGFRSIEEIQPSRHRLRLRLGHGADEAVVHADVARSTRQRIGRAERDGITVVRHDVTVRADDDPGPGFRRPEEPVRSALERFYDLLLETGERRQFRLGPRTTFVDWWEAAYAAGLLVHLEARDALNEPLAGLLLYRHGGRLSTAHSADRAGRRHDHPGVLHLLRWRSIQLAIRSGCAEMDFGGVDVPGARREPRPGEPMAGLYEHKRSFGASWVEQVGAHEVVIRRWRYAAGRMLAAGLRRISP